MIDKSWTGEYEPKNMLEKIRKYDEPLAEFLGETMRRAMELNTKYPDLDDEIVGLICCVYDGISGEV